MVEYLKPKKEAAANFPEYPSGMGWRLEDIESMGVRTITEDMLDLFFNLENLNVSLSEKQASLIMDIDGDIKTIAKSVFGAANDENWKTKYVFGLTSLVSHLARLEADDDFWKILPENIQDLQAKDMAERTLEILKPGNEELLREYIGNVEMPADERRKEIEKYEMMKRGFPREYVREKFKRFVPQLQMLLLQQGTSESGEAVH